MERHVAALVAYLYAAALVVNETSSSGVFHARLLTSTSTDLEDQLEAAWHWLPRCPATSSCNTSILACLSHAHTSSIPSSSSSSSLSSLSASSSLSSSSSSVQPLCVTPTPAVSASHTHLIARFPIEFTWPGSFRLTVEVRIYVAGQKHDTPSGGKLVDRLSTHDSIEAGITWHESTLIRDSTVMTGDRDGGRRSTPRVAYRLLCDTGYYGRRCSLSCNPRRDKFGHYSCAENGTRVCVDGWTGSFCDVPVCLAGCHSVNGYCDQPNECKCRVGWRGNLCDECIPYPGCQNGTCDAPWQCNCFEGWGGLYCNQDLKFCSHYRPCRNSATCLNTGLGSYACACLPDFTGPRCEVDLAGCPYVPCLNDGVCIDLGSESRCSCPSGFAGRRCELVTRSCETNPCHNGATCTAVFGTYHCACSAGYTGFNCDVDLDECFSDPCLNGGSCLDAIGTFQCVCAPGFSGDRCEIDRDECAVNPCLNGGRCVDQPNDFECQCPAGFVGALCQHDVDECLARPCANGGTCKQLVNDFLCTCTPGFAGRYCTIAVDSCRSSPCHNDGTCVDGAGAFECRCPLGFVGLLCETDLLPLISAGHKHPPGVVEPSRPPVVPRRPRVSSRSSRPVGGGSREAVSTVQPLLFVASFGLALPIVFVACAFAVWIHRRHRRRRQRAAAVAAAERPVDGLNNQRPHTTITTIDDENYRPTTTTTTTDDRFKFVDDYYDSGGGEMVRREKNRQRDSRSETGQPHHQLSVDHHCYEELCHRGCCRDSVWYTHGSAGIVHCSHAGCDAGTRCNIHRGRAPSGASRTGCAITSSTTPEVGHGPCAHHAMASSSSGNCDAGSSASVPAQRPSSPSNQQVRPRPATDSQLATDV